MKIFPSEKNTKFYGRMFSGLCGYIKETTFLPSKKRCIAYGCIFLVVVSYYAGSYVVSTKPYVVDAFSRYTKPFQGVNRYCDGDVFRGPYEGSKEGWHFYGKEIVKVPGYNERFSSCNSPMIAGPNVILECDSGELKAVCGLMHSF